MALGEEHVQDFSPDGQLFALINDQGILRIWDTETNALKQEYTLNLHLAGPCTALVWIQVNERNNSNKGTRISSLSNSLTNKEGLYIALGTSSGKVALYSYAHGKIERNLSGEGHTGKIRSITYDNLGVLYTCGEDCQVIAWSVLEGKQQCVWNVGSDKPYSILYMEESKNLIVSSRRVKVYSVDTQQLKQTFTGHNSDIDVMSSAVTSNGVEYVATASRLKRTISLWNIGRRESSTSGTLLTEDVLMHMNCQIYESNLIVSVVTKSGLIHIYSIPEKNIYSKEPIKPTLTVTIASEGETSLIPAIVASLKHSKLPQGLLLGYGNKRCMYFEHIALKKLEERQVLVRADPKKLNGNKCHGKGSGSGGFLSPVINTEEVEYKSVQPVHKKKLKSGDIPMELRLDNLILNASDSNALPQAQSKVNLLMQALHSKDNILLQSVLCTNSVNIIRLTLQRLPVQYVGTLVNELTLLMQLKRVNVEFSIAWLKILANTHSSQLMAIGADDLLNKFGPCMGIIEHRVNCLKELSKLNGRIQLLLSQIDRNAEEDNMNIENVVVFDDNADISDRHQKSSSDEEWGEEDDDENNSDDDDEMEEDPN